MSRKNIILIILFGLALFIGVTVATYYGYTAQNPSGNDFYSRWAGARALLIDGKDPYSLEVTAEIQVVKNIDPSQLGKGSFAYPLHVIYLFLPLVYVEYAWAQAAWMVILEGIVLITVLLLMRLFNWQPSIWAIAGLIVGTILLYPVARSILLGQFTLHVLLFLVAMLLCLRNGRDVWAGAFLAATSVKPQMVPLIGLWLVIWAIQQKRWRFIGGILGGGAAMFFTSLLFFPRWPISFVEDAFRYSNVAGGKNPLLILSTMIIPNAAEAVRLSLSVVLVLAMIGVCWRVLRHNDNVGFLYATYWVITVSLLVLFQTGSTNQVLLLIPMFDWLAQLRHTSKGVWLAAAIFGGSVVGLWALFLLTHGGVGEQPINFLPGSMLSLAVLVGLEWHVYRRKETAVIPPQ